MGRLLSLWASGTPVLRRCDRCLEVREEGLPSGPVLVTPLSGPTTQPFPAAMLDLDPGDAGALGDEPDLDLLRV
jgi:hypothetical protein